MAGQVAHAGYSPNHPAPWPVVLMGLAALLAQSAHPPLEWTVMAWLALIPMVLALQIARAAGSPVFWGGLLFGIISYTGSFSWLYESLVDMAGIGWPRALSVMVLLIGLMALFPALLLATVHKAMLRWGWRAGWIFPPAWAGLDGLLGWMPFGGVPWASSAATQAATPMAAWIAPWLGASGIVWVMALTASITVGGLGGLQRTPRRGLMALTAAALLVGGSLWLPRPALVETGLVTPPLRALLVPGDLDVPMMRRTRGQSVVVRHYLNRSLRALLQGPGQPATPPLVIWPESAFSGQVRQGTTLSELSQLAELWNAGILLGADGMVGARETNSVFLVTGRPSAVARYDKRQLVPFGEYVPSGFRWLLGGKITAGDDDYLAGSAEALLPWLGGQLGIALCFESILPGHARAAVRGGAQVLITLANDAWLSPAAALHHARLSQLRGLETGRPVVLVSNRGFSGLMLSNGKAHIEGPGSAPQWVTITRRTHQTPWVRHGLLPLLLVLTLHSLLALAHPRRGNPA